MKYFTVFALLAVSWLVSAAPCHAALLTYRMTLTNASPLTQAGEEIGYLSFDDALMPTPGSNFLPSPNILTELSMVFDGQFFDTTNTNSSGMRFDDFDRPEVMSFGTDCDPPSCRLVIGTEGWIGSVGFADGVVEGGLFQYTHPTLPGTAFVNIDLALVPVPPALILFGSALFCLRRFSCIKK